MASTHYGLVVVAADVAVAVAVADAAVVVAEHNAADSVGDTGLDIEFDMDVVRLRAIVAENVVPEQGVEVLVTHTFAEG